jgi:oligopeptide transport system substrate-binding protein
MKELGVTKLPPITYLYNTSDRNKAIAETLQATWKNVLGVDVKLLNKETKVYLDDQEQGKFEITRSSWTADYNDSINFLQKFVEKYSSSNITRWHSPKYTELIQKSYVESDPEKRKQILLEAETLLMDEMPLTGLFSDVNAWVQNDKVKGVRIDPLSKIDFKWAYKEE